MKKIILSIIGVLFFIVTSLAQQLPNRYLQNISSTFQVTKDVVFSTNIPTVKSFNLFGNRLAYEDTYGDVKTTLKMNIYRPSNDTLTKRPVIIFAFGGGFVNGSRTETSMIKLCESFAKRGFVTATIDYRLGMNIGDKELSKRAVYRALQDGRSAVRFFRKNAALYGVDPNQIYISGHSAGAFLAYQAVYLDKDIERPASTRNYFGRPDLGGLDAIGDNKTYTNGNLVSGKANGVMGFAGALGDLSYIENASDIPGVYFHSSNDSTVPYNSGEPFSYISWLPGFNLPTVYGSNQMNNRTNALNAPHAFYSYTNRGHNVHFNGSNLYSDITPNGAHYFYNTFLKPNGITLDGYSSICSSCLTQSYSVMGNAFYYDWQITGGTLTYSNPLDNTVTVTWDLYATNKTLTVTPYSRQLARGTTINLEVSVNSRGFAKNETESSTTSNTLVAPNPFTNTLNVTITNAYLGEVEIVIYDVTGRMIAQRKVLKNETVLTENFGDAFQNSGMYFMQISSAKNEPTIHRIYKQ
ncbi:carboxylesterase family protein [Flavobacterium sp. J27]|uniref:carboxylesterase family protein n=1 Tax=Flavobacterium sp. J27 TaxID=2060419 RepID=UPI00102F43A9|nr:carboxylesterase family protein [Flavobacterium sp. J27]